jgi:TonB-dependent receptor
MNNTSVSHGVSLASWLGRFAAGFLVLLSLAASAAAAETGTVVGTVSSASTHNGLQGAIVTAPGLNRSAQTDSTGRFVLGDLPAGSVELVITYTGFTDFHQSVAVAAGDTARFDAEMKSAEAVTLAPYTVSAVREGQSLAITEQRNAPNVKDVMAIDAWGNLPNMSIGELAMRMPGISVPSANGLDDDNVVMNVSIRGMDPNLTRLNIDGLPVTSVSGTGRTASLHSFTGALYEQVEVHDGATPDMSPNSIGGQLNLITRSPLNMKENRRINYSVGLRWAPPFWYRTTERAERDLHPSFSATYREVYDIFGGHRNLGISLNAYYSELVNMIDYRQFNYANWGTTTPGAVNNFSSTTGLDSRHYESISLRADYRFSEASKYSLNFIFNRGAEPSYDQTVLTASGTVTAGYTPNATTLSSGTFALANAHWSFYSQNPTLTFRGEHKWDRLALDYSARYSYMHFDSGSGNHGQGGALAYKVTSAGLAIDKSDPNGHILTQTTGASIYDLASYTAGNAVPASNGVDNPTSNITFTKRSAYVDQPTFIAVVNGAYDLNTRIPFKVKGGLSFDERIWSYRNNFAQQWYHTNTGTLPAVYVPLSAFDVQQGGTRLPEVDTRAVALEVGSRPDLWVERPYYQASVNKTSRRYADETVTAGYLMGETRFGKLSLLGGVRQERTKDTNWSFVQRPTAELLTITQQPDPVLRADANFRKLLNTGSYSKMYPSLHATYDLTNNLKARASYSTSYAAPNFATLVPSLSVSLPSPSNPTGSVTSNTAGLKPQYSKNFDYRVDYYTKDSGVFTVGYFTKKITDYIITNNVGFVGSGSDNGFNGDYAGYQYFTSYNAGSVDVKGWQINYQQQFTFLPGLLKGLTLSANYTKLQTEGDFGGIFTGTSALTHLTTGQVTGFTPESANFMAVYNYRGWTTRVIVNYTGQYISSFTAPTTANPDTTGNFYRQPLTLVNAGVSYRYSPAVSFSIDATNITQKGPTFFRYTSDHLRELRRMPSTITFGVNGQF